MASAQDSEKKDEDKDSAGEPTREDESGDVAEPDAPTAEEENIGMNTILGGNSLTGVQRDSGDE